MLPTTTPQGAWGAENTSAKDLVLPRIKVCQATSAAAKEGLALPGNIISSTTNEVLAKKGEKLELLPILSVGSWVVNKVIPGGQPEFMRQEPLTPENDSEEWAIPGFDEANNNQAIVRQKVLSFLVLLPERVQGFPLWIDFTKTNKKAGKLLSTIMQENRMLGKPSPSRVVGITTAVRTFKNNSWFVCNLAPTRDATQEEVNACFKWYERFRAAQVAVNPEVEADDDGIR